MHHMLIVSTEYNPKTIKIEVIVRDDQVDGIIHKIADKLRTSDIVGKLFVLDVPIALDIRANKTGLALLF